MASAAMRSVLKRSPYEAEFRPQFLLRDDVCAGLVILCAGCLKPPLNLACSPQEALTWLMAGLTRFPAKACPAHLDSGVDPGSPPRRRIKTKSQSLRSDSNGTEALGDAAEMLRNLAAARAEPHYV
jgi:hypothetical protein